MAETPSPIVPSAPQAKVPLPGGKMPIPGGKMPMPMKMAMKGPMKLPMPQLNQKFVPKPTVVAPKATVPAMKKVFTTSKTKEEDSDDDELGALMSSAPKPPKPVIRKEPKPKVAPVPQAGKKRPRPPSPSSSSRSQTPSSSSRESSVSSYVSERSGTASENMTLFDIAKEHDLIPRNVEETQEEEKATYVPPRPPKTKFPHDIDAKIKQVEATVNKSEAALRMKDDNKSVALSTSKINYIDPRIVCAWCKNFNLPVNRVYTAAVIKKFPWAVNVEDEFKF